jgi:hypothetical protein
VWTPDDEGMYMDECQHPETGERAFVKTAAQQELGITDIEADELFFVGARHEDTVAQLDALLAEEDARSMVTTANGR